MTTIFDKPLNSDVSSNTQAIADKPDYATEMPMSSSDATKVSQAIAKINPNVISCTSLSDFESKLNTLLASMTDGEERNIVYAPGGTYAPFAGYNHAGLLYRVNSTNAWCDLRRNGVAMYGTLQSGTWSTWEKLALKSDLTPSGYTAPTNIHANATLVQGGYVRVGNLIVVNCRFTINTAISATTTIAKFPGYTKTGISYSHVALANNKLIDLGIDQGGDLRSPVQVTTGTLVISGVYFALS